MVSPTRIEGANFADQRGEINFFNTFDMREVVRFYEIAPSDTMVIRAWQAHRKEKKWMYCHTGAFLVQLIEIADFDDPAKGLEAKKYILDAKNPTVLEIPGGYANGFKALQSNSKLMVFSNMDLEASKNDDHRYPMDYWKVDWE